MVNVRPETARAYLDGIAPTRSDVVIAVPAGMLHALREIINTAEPPPTPKALSKAHCAGIARMLATPYESDLARNSEPETKLRACLLMLAEAIGAHCLAGHTDQQIMRALEGSHELLAAIIGVRMGQEEWTW